MRLPRLVNAILGPKVVHRELPKPQAGNREALVPAAPGPPGVQAVDPYVLFLRTFGDDGGLRAGNSRDGTNYELVMFESIVRDAVGDFGLGFKALHDERAKMVPSAVDYVASPHDEWKVHFRSMLARATATVVLSPLAGPPGDSLVYELETIRRCHARRRVIIACPPSLTFDHRTAKSTVFRKLGWQDPPHPPILAWQVPNGDIAMYASLGTDDDSLRARYAEGLREALTSICR